MVLCCDDAAESVYKPSTNHACNLTVQNHAASLFEGAYDCRD